MGDVVLLPRPASQALPVSFENSFWADRHQHDDAPVIATTPALQVVPDCSCTAGTVCRHNNACPRLSIRRGASCTVAEFRP